MCLLLSLSATSDSCQGTGFTCAVVAIGETGVDNGVKCWGIGGPWLGYEDTDSRGHASGTMGDQLDVVDLGDALQGAVSNVACGDKFVCAWAALSGIKCWGENSNGELGTGTANEHGGSPGTMGNNLPLVAVPGEAGKAEYQVVVAGKNHACAAVSPGSNEAVTIYCWCALHLHMAWCGGMENENNATCKHGSASSPSPAPLTPPPPPFYPFPPPHRHCHLTVLHVYP